MWTKIWKINNPNKCPLPLCSLLPNVLPHYLRFPLIKKCCVHTPMIDGQDGIPKTFKKEMPQLVGNEPICVYSI